MSHYYDTRRTTQTPPMLKFVYSDGRQRKKNFNKLCMSTIDLRNLCILLDVMNSVYDKVIANQPICNISQLQLFTLIIYSFFSSQNELEHWR